ncbi:MAG: hypothetical protein HC844_06510, partial [Tabrizicola sp.]|nr:hypothetical protein [Tabrizicola sp.]
TNFLRADGTWAAPAGGGGGGSGDVAGPASATDSALVRFDGTTGKLVQNSGVLLPDDDTIVLPAVAAPGVPLANRIALFGRAIAGRMLAMMMGPSGIDTPLQPHIGFNAYVKWQANGNATTTSIFGTAVSTGGTATQAAVTAGRIYTQMKRLYYRVTTAATTAVSFLRFTNRQYFVGGASAELGGFFSVINWGPDTGVTNGSHRAFAGMNQTNSSDVEPSSLNNMIGMGWDSGDANIQFMHSGVAATTKIDLGAAFPKPVTTNNQTMYEIVLFSPPGTTQAVGYRIRDLESGAVTSGLVTTNLPAVTQAIGPVVQMSVGGVSSVVGVAVCSIYAESDY